MADFNNVNSQPQYRSRIRTSIYGARLGIDDDNALVGPIGVKEAVSTLGSTATALRAHGVYLLNAAAASTYVLDPPIPGVSLRVFQTSNASSHSLITGTSNIKIHSTLGSSQQRICLQSTGDFADLVGLTTAIWAYLGGSAGVCLTT